ncbi:MAG TPA: thioredoxin-like domain-containing protein [Xanthomonadaceae bacterium]|nr:thioredoxin-like domain-containing protein [Xanthomonadaceae bacterium]
MIGATSRSDRVSIPAPSQRSAAFEIPAHLQWINSNAPITLGSLHRRVVLLDFWSSSGVHCAHHVADMRYLQDRFNEGVTVVGIHVPKFEHERQAPVVAAAVRRLQVRHPVANDPDFVLWQHYGIRSWPTAVVIDAAGRMVVQLAGDGSREQLVDVIERLLEEAVDTDLRAFAAADVFRALEPRSVLSFPARIAADVRRLYVADTGHNRVLECSHDGRVLRTFGNGNPDLVDGRGHQASLHAPHGLALAQDALYVADTGNHAIRRIRLPSGEVETVAGLGHRGHAGSRRMMRPRESALSGPIDLAVSRDHLYIAMSGCHQVWSLDLVDHTLQVLAGSGRLGAGDGAPMSASLAQPSGLAMAGRSLVVADADASALRTIALDGGGEVATLIGAGLFEFGYVDGHRANARMQFPQGLCSDPRGQQIHVADSYNHAIRVFQMRSGELRTLALPTVRAGRCGAGIGGVVDRQQRRPRGGPLRPFQGQRQPHCRR